MPTAELEGGHLRSVGSHLPSAATRHTSLGHPLTVLHLTEMIKLVPLLLHTLVVAVATFAILAEAGVRAWVHGVLALSVTLRPDAQGVHHIPERTVGELVHDAHETHQHLAFAAEIDAAIHIGGVVGGRAVAVA